MVRATFFFVRHIENLLFVRRSSLAQWIRRVDENRPTTNWHGVAGGMKRCAAVRACPLRLRRVRWVVVVEGEVGQAQTAARCGLRAGSFLVGGRPGGGNPRGAGCCLRASGGRSSGCDGGKGGVEPGGGSSRPGIAHPSYGVIDAGAGGLDPRGGWASGGAASFRKSGTTYLRRKAGLSVPAWPPRFPAAAMA